MKKTGKLKVNSKLSGLIKARRTKYSIPKFYNLAPREKFNNQECEFELDGGTVVKVWVGGQELPKDEQLLEKQEKKAERKAEREAVKQKKKAFQGDFRGDSFKMEKAQVPSDTRQTVIGAAEFDNFALKLNRFAHFDENDKDGKFKFFQNDKKKGNFVISPQFGDSPTSAAAQRTLLAAQALCGQNVLAVEMKPSWRLAVGLGGASVYETDMTLHHLYGVPYIPGSAIKGVVRSWYYTKKYAEIAEENNEIAEGLALQGDQLFCDLFGCPEEAVLADRNKNKKKYSSYYNKAGLPGARMGNIVFFDAFPVDTPSIEVDIMNPHYPADKDPVDYNEPVPVPFLTVADTSFQFLIGLRPSQVEQKKEWWGEITKLLKEALENKGIGAKTAVGYGYMRT